MTDSNSYKEFKTVSEVIRGLAQLRAYTRKMLPASTVNKLLYMRKTHSYSLMFCL